MAASKNIGIDIGGTKTTFVLLEGNKILKKEKVATPKSKREIIECLTLRVKKWGKVTGIGIGVPGPLNEKRDLILNPPNLKILHNCPLAKLIEKETGLKTRMDNDANCFALAESLLGAGRGAKLVVAVTLGTGIGGGIVINGKIYPGAFGAAGEVGHMTIENKFWERVAAKNRKNYNKYGKYLGIGLSNLINVLDPEIIVLGGGMVNHYHAFIKRAKKEIKERVLSPLSKKKIKIKKAALGQWGGAVGAALLSKYARS